MNKKIIKRILAISLALICCIGVSITAISCAKTNKENPPEKVESVEEGEIQVSSMNSKGITLQSKKLSYEQYNYYGVSPTAEASQLLTATIGPDYATNKNVIWTVDWKNPEATWAKGKTVTDYVTVTPTSDGANTAVVANLKAFSEQVIITVKSESDPEVFATATVDYAKRLIGGYVNLGATNEVSIVDGGWGVNLGLDTKFMITEDVAKREFSDGTIDDTFTFSAVIRVNDTALNRINSVTGYTFTAPSGINFSVEMASLSDLIYYEGKPIEGEALEDLNYYLYNNNETQLFQLEVTYIGIYSNYLNIIPFHITRDGLFVSVTNIGLDKPSLVF